jgi:hypothetical protein
MIEAYRHPRTGDVVLISWYETPGELIAHMYSECVEGRRDLNLATLNDNLSREFARLRKAGAVDIVPTIMDGAIHTSLVVTGELKPKKENVDEKQDGVS